MTSVGAGPETIGGIVPPILTPLNPAGEVDLRSLARLVSTGAPMREFDQFMRRGRLGEVLEYLGQLRGLTPSQARERVAADLEIVGLSAYKDRPVIELSKGMTQRAQMVAVATPC